MDLSFLVGMIAWELFTSHQDDFAFEVEMHGCGECVSSVGVCSCELSSFRSDVDRRQTKALEEIVCRCVLINNSTDMQFEACLLVVVGALTKSATSLSSSSFTFPN
jgi:hypothetical protein